MKKKKGKKENFLELIPKKVENVDWEVDDKGIVKIIVWRNSILDKIVRKFFNTPEKTVIDLDEMGSFVWKSIDGNRDVYAISQMLKDEMGEEVEPLYDRIVTYLNILKNNKFIKFDRN